VSTATTRLERDFDPAAVQELKAVATSDLTIGGANLAARAFAAGLVDECQLFVWPMIVWRRQTGPAGGLPHPPRAPRRAPIQHGVVRLLYRSPS
jgi:riboflavin biosynthesis pyrimidine reductase